MRTQNQWLFETPTYSGGAYDQEIEFEDEWELDEYDNELAWELAPAINVDKAVEYNLKHMASVGWQPYASTILTWLASTTPFMLTDDRTFAQAIARWQQQQGLTPDGKIGPNTWTRMKAALGIQSTTKPSTSSKPTGGNLVSGNCIQQGTCQACERRLKASNPVQLVPVPSTLKLSSSKIQLNQQALNDYQQLYQAAKANGIPDPFLKITSGYRSYSTQAGLWKGRLLTKFRNLGCSEASLPCIGHAIDRTNKTLQSTPVPHSKNLWLDQFLKELKQGSCSLSCDPRSAVSALRQGTAPPGASPHHTGRAVDVFVGKAPGANSSTSTASSHVAWQRKQPAFQWLVCNAARFGFYPYNNEPWHWEYNPST